ncbi:helix-turn-helix domain-containing protein [Streptomyces canus]|uniref:helix-turn-helix domain-containing protein n=1 Tax=Streptomyces canus TaxID=58343 RepID=UPI00380811DF
MPVHPGCPATFTVVGTAELRRLLTLMLEHESSTLPLRPGAKRHQVALTHEQLAALVGTSRETVTKVLHQFAEQGLIRPARGRITVLKTEQLCDEAG